jgi:hypothetical protein
LHRNAEEKEEDGNQTGIIPGDTGPADTNGNAHKALVLPRRGRPVRRPFLWRRDAAGPVLQLASECSDSALESAVLPDPQCTAHISLKSEAHACESELPVEAGGADGDRDQRTIEAPSSQGLSESSKVLPIVKLYGKYTRALTFQNF